MPIDEEPDVHRVAEGAERLALKTVIRIIVDHASSVDPSLREQIDASIEAYIKRLDPQSELEREFAEQARAAVAVLVEPSR